MLSEQAVNSNLTNTLTCEMIDPNRLGLNAKIASGKLSPLSMETENGTYVMELHFAHHKATHV